MKENISCNYKFTGKGVEVMALIILAGGASSRMGGNNKALLPLGRVTMLERIVSGLAPLFTDIILVTNDGNPLHDSKVRTVGDIFPGLGPLSGIHAGLAASREAKNFVLACDLPLIKPELVEFLLSRATADKSSLTDGDIVIPAILGNIEPLVAVYDKRMLGTVENFIQMGKYKLRDIFSELQVDYVSEEEIRRVDPELESFLNVNTPADYEKVLQILTGRGER